MEERANRLTLQQLSKPTLSQLDFTTSLPSFQLPHHYLPILPPPPSTISLSFTLHSSSLHGLTTAGNQQLQPVSVHCKHSFFFLLSLLLPFNRPMQEFFATRSLLLVIPFLTNHSQTRSAPSFEPKQRGKILAESNKAVEKQVLRGADFCTTLFSWSRTD